MSNKELPKYLEKESAEIRQKVEELVDLAFNKGINAAVEEAKKSGPFVLDALHDAIIKNLSQSSK